jgi:multidrug resistance efflux pump
MKLFGRKGETALVVKEQPVVVSVPDIKEYLVNEYERVDKLRQKNEYLELQLEQARETKYKYDAALVTLDEYKKRLERAEQLLDKEKQKSEDARKETAKVKDEINSYKIILHDAALTKEAIADEIVCEFKSNLVENFNKIKGNLSKSIVAVIINETELHPTEKGGEG